MVTTYLYSRENEIRYQKHGSKKYELSDIVPQLIDMKHEMEEARKLPLDIIRFHEQFTTDLEQLSLKEKDNTDDEEDSVDAPQEDRPVTPIEVAVKKAPKTLQEMKDLIHKRLPIRDDVKTVKSHDQFQLASILISELNSVWPDMRKQAPDPFLNNSDNKELERRVAVEVVRTIEHLYECYILKLRDANLKGVFSSTSNVSRLKTQLSIEANKSLNILNIRRKLAYDLRHPDKIDDNVSEDSFIAKVRRKMSERTKAVPVGRIAKKLQMTRMQAEELYNAMQLKEIDENIKDLELAKIPNVNIQKRPKQKSEASSSVVDTEKHFHRDVSQDSLSTKQMLTGHDEILQFKLQKSNSLPQVDTAQLFLEELELTPADLNMKRKGSTDHYPFYPDIEKQEFKESTERQTSSTRKDLEELLLKERSIQTDRNLTDSFENIPEDMPPLLQALPINQKERRIRKKIDDRDDSMIETDSNSIASTIPSIQAIDPALDKSHEKTNELHIQPAVVSKKMKNQHVVRTSDVRVSNRTNISQITLKKHQPIYNSFKGEIDDATVKLLDSSLFAGDEIKEVYEEVAKTLNAEHLQFDQDEFVVKCPAKLQSIDGASNYSFSALTGNKIMNQTLIGRVYPPWNQEGADEWKNSPKFGGLGRQEILQLKDNAEKEFSKQDNLLGNNNQKKPAKSYSAWLAWWRSTINCEDFYKYISAKENDFLTKIFHLYDSDGDNDGKADSSEITSEDAEIIAQREKMLNNLAELAAKKKEYKDGFWNVDTINLGGLGKDPEVNAISRQAKSIDGRSFGTHAHSPERQMKHSFQESTEYFVAPQITLQDRLENVWNKLKMPEKLRLDMAIKYSLNEYSSLLNDAIAHWESASDCIVQREEIIFTLENFERVASDPNRFFQKGSKHSSLDRIEESKTRNALHKQLDKLDGVTKRAISVVHKKYKDVVTYQGRPYHEKMNSDKVEMLYWLQQERRAALLDSASAAISRGKASDLPPISTVTLL